MSDPYVRMVREFHEAFSLPVRDMPDVGTPEERVLRVRLLLEEVLEFTKAAGVLVAASAPVGEIALVDAKALRVDAVAGPNLTAMAHELADVQYVTSGTAVQLGIPLLAVTQEVHAANLRKPSPDGKPILDKRGKVRKPEGWRPADVGAVLKRLNEGEE